MSKKTFTAQDIEDYITEYRATGGKPTGRFAGPTRLLLHSGHDADGKPHIVPLSYFADADKDRCVVLAINDGLDEDPRWLRHLRAHPEVTAEIGSDTVRLTATEIHGAERDAIYARHAETFPILLEFQSATTRVIPVVALAPTGNA
ncbi:deazaflavin-dependent oxidoreductase, nitroreductase family [Frankia torreyi]|uniref:Deazaflavin-dependent oxidoreductase, nitroreductase family n=1 Tax=Frankia torreyi TaxID=1856 RepID=A0A0D8B8G8_9ACTN|nr:MULTISPECIES: nitroreductase/quinone reductase family protein [Frankia]KJE20583.1 deazaflavin-dependent oxidoreductase, nitroreductase family [Frankia torreyi]KQM02939.1 deazaflavin-dependent oxidoreductase, nitroreductase family [Frankia sp. CpI1-P]